MIDRCDDEIATWSLSGENFVVKNVEKFACVSTPTCCYPYPYDTPIPVARRPPYT
jgi:hypothetical protein